jgi:hypothetical protein
MITRAVTLVPPLVLWMLWVRCGVGWKRLELTRTALDSHPTHEGDS